MQNAFITELEWRGLIYQKTPEIEKAFEKGTTMYLGYDPTGPDLHIGHLLGILTLRRALQHGQKIVVLVGGGTSMIGDPGGKDAERPIVPREVIVANKASLKEQFSKFFDFDEKKVTMVDNADWLEKLTLISFLRDAGKHISVNQMIDKDSVANRIGREHGISYAEFSYQLLQAYDFMELYKTHQCEVQLGGSDQWGNLVQGVELIRKAAGGSAFALSHPLIVNPKTGKKFGKTETGQAIWLRAEKTHPYNFYQFFVNVEDSLAPTLLKYFSFKTKAEIEEIEKHWGIAHESRSLQKVLAYEMTELVHGKETAEKCKHVAELIFEKGIEASSLEDLNFIKAAVPYKKISNKEDFKMPNIAFELGLVPSNAEARRLYSQNGISEKLLYDRYFIVRKGKREYGIVEVA